jgi:adenine-specific DNA-methyltransferase
MVEQLAEHIDVGVKRLRNIAKGKGNHSFMYFELKKYNQEYIDAIMEATSIKELEELYVDMRNNAFLKFWFDRGEFEKDENFRGLDLDGRKQALADILDENQLYLNYADMNDTRHTVSAAERALTNRFYGEAE